MTGKPGKPYISPEYRRVNPSEDLPKPSYGSAVGLTCPGCPPSNMRSLTYIKAGEDTVKVRSQPLLSNVLHQPAQSRDLNDQRWNEIPNPVRPVCSWTIDQHSRPPKNIDRRAILAVSDNTANRAVRLSVLQVIATYTEISHPPSKTHLQQTQYLGKNNLHLKDPRLYQLSAPKVWAESDGSFRSKAWPYLNELARNRHNERPPILLSTKDIRPPVITHHFKNWPVAIFADCPGLVRQAKEAAGASWDEHVLVWDEMVRNWRDISVCIPNRYQSTARNLVNCLPSQQTALTEQLQDALESLGLGKPMLPKPPGPISSSTAADIANNHLRDPIQVLTSAPQQYPSKGQVGSSENPISFLDKPDSDSEFNAHNLQQDGRMSPVTANQTAHPSTPDTLLSRPDQPVAGHDGTLLTCPPGVQKLDQKPFANVMLQEWPGEDLLVSSLLEWFDASSVRGTRVPQWIVRYGSTYRFNEQTINRYWRFIDKVKNPTMRQWFQEWPQVGVVNQHNLRVSQARHTFQREFNEVSKLKTTIASERLLDKPSRGHKRKGNSHAISSSATPPLH
ncbi:uncharacterized protein MELLADRAFT_61963 [Melampsora larici-populina 98AG31]|uniref:Uncharacterized protein n=1 Tax=Melampsora larici-populina (strain 98AG31 / pathotype 3-4-7) TaxID=747676 RepID=F4RHF6_MELLP|nr:uncharacterized protein MELLADRAFT_61963 [Melampsora larici-populina 98AG31]EGG08364.1 hypothetical protein MELLADRAFT_61963 [Melampsora larici-populina 98AG31]